MLVWRPSQANWHLSARTAATKVNWSHWSKQLGRSIWNIETIMCIPLETIRSAHSLIGHHSVSWLWRSLVLFDFIGRDMIKSRRQMQLDSFSHRAWIFIGPMKRYENQQQQQQHRTGLAINQAAWNQTTICTLIGEKHAGSSTSRICLAKQLSPLIKA